MHRKFRHQWGVDEIHNLINRTCAEINLIENGLMRGRPTLSRWQGLYMATTKNKKWYFAYRIEPGTDENNIFVEDACHAQNMHETKVIRISEFKFQKLLSECILEIIKEIA